MVYLTTVWENYKNYCEYSEIELVLMQNIQIIIVKILKNRLVLLEGL